MKNIKHKLKEINFIFPIILLIRGYQILISPFVPGCCRFQPTCSNYSLMAIKVFGFTKGIYLSTKRILRCHPWGGFGYDPIPPASFGDKSNKPT